MENFIVSARKYRPATFDMVVGQKNITNTLKNAIRNNHLAQAFLFCGPRGVGKTTCARILAKTINCENPDENLEPCNVCKSCDSFNKSASFNIHELDAASNNSVDDIRYLVDQVRVPPQVGKYKVYIIDEVHMLSSAAFNAFLKTLEEPPPYAKFILATTEKHKIIPTILSRCQIYDFKRITVADIVSYLTYVAEQEGVEVEPEALHVIGQKSDGAMRDALSIFDQIVSFAGKSVTYSTVIENLNVLDYDYYFRITDAILHSDISNTMLIINEIIDNGFDGQHFLVGFGEHLRNLLVCKDPETIPLLEAGGGMAGRYTEQSEKCPAPFLIRSLDILNTCDVNYKTSNNKKLHLELSLLRMCSLNAGDGVLEKVQEEKKEPSKPGKTPQKSAYTVPAGKTVKAGETPPVKIERSGKPGRTPIPKTRSINLQEDAEEQDTDNEPEKRKPANREPFKQEDLEKKWHQFAETQKRDANFHITLTKHQPVLRENYSIGLPVDNSIQATEVNERKSEILAFLRKELRNDHIQLAPETARESKSSKPYTPRDKYNAMVKKNPALKKFRENLDLEIDF